MEEGRIRIQIFCAIKTPFKLTPTSIDTISAPELPFAFEMQA